MPRIFTKNQNSSRVDHSPDGQNEHRLQGAILWILVVFGLIATTAVAIYQVYNLLDEEQQSTHRRISQLEDQMVDEQRLKLQRQTQYNEVIARLDNADDELRELPRRDVARSRYRLTLGEAEHLLQMADWQLKLHRDPEAALFALRKAYDRLDIYSDHPPLQRVALAVRREIEKLRVRKVANLDDEFQKILELQKLLLLLPPNTRLDLTDFTEPTIKRPKPIDANFNAVADPTEEKNRGADEAWWKRYLSTLVEIRDSDWTMRDHRERYQNDLFWGNILSLINRAQMALVLGNQTVYRDSLDEVLKLVRLVWQNDEPRRRQIDELIAQMRQQNISFNLPNLTGIREQLASAVADYQPTRRSLDGE